MIRFEQCRIEFGDRLALHDLDWHITSGQHWVVVGPNGSGKSALVDALTGEGKVTEGRRELQARIALVSLEEQARLIERERRRDDSDITNKVFAGTPAREMLQETSRDPDLQARLIDLLGVGPILNRGFRKLSTGETRKLLLIRALCSHPDVLALDEPFEGLDAVSVPFVQQVLAEFAPQITMVMALNRFDDIPDFATHIAQIEAGTIQQTFSSNSATETRKLLRQLEQISSSNLQLPPPEHTPPLPLNPDGSLVRIHNGRIAYTDNLVFEGVDWEIRPGEHWQVKGPNGSGKTCLLHLITGDHPQCYVNDVQLFGYQRGQGESIWQVKQHLGFVSTALHWDYRLSVRVHHVVLSGFFDSIGLYQSASERQRDIADAWLELLGLKQEARAPFSSLSFGLQRVILIARAMVKHPPLLLLDEPCLGLDEANRQLVLSLTERICEESRSTLVYVTHHEEDRIEHIQRELVLG